MSSNGLCPINVYQIVYVQAWFMSSAGGVTLLDPDLFWDPELDIGPHRLMASGTFLSLQNR